MESNKDYVLNNFKVFLTIPSMLNSIRKGEYNVVPIRTYLGIVLGLGYLFFPLDFLNDVIPVIGQLDDIAILAFMLKLMAPEVTRYYNWRSLN